MKLFEAVPNFSEGRNSTVVDRLVSEARGVPGVTVLDVELNADHNRAVISLVGEGGALPEALFRMIRKAVELIDLRQHRGEHPRMGAADVVPFVPMGESTMEEAIRLAEELGERVWKELGVPVYLYGAAARRPERADLGVVRQGEFEGLRDAIGSDPGRRPDFGDPKVHPTAGAVAIGARPVLIAYNAYLTTPDVSIAKKIAHAVRARDGGLSEVKALGFTIRTRDRAQVSMNLTDFRKTPLHRALEAVRREAGRYGAEVEESEVVGLIPEDALLDAAEYYLQLNRFERTQILERKLRAVSGGEAGTRASAVPLPGRFSKLSLAEFLGAVAARTPTPGGGSVSALAGALGAALGEMVIVYSNPTTASAPPALAAVGQELVEGRDRLLALVDEDAAAYEMVRATRRQLRETAETPGSSSSYRDALRQAAEVPLETARLARRLTERLEAVRSETKTALGSDLVSALALLRGAAEGALANVAINLDDLREAGLPVADLASEMERLSAAR